MKAHSKKKKHMRKCDDVPFHVKLGFWSREWRTENHTHLRPASLPAIWAAEEPTNVHTTAQEDTSTAELWQRDTAHFHFTDMCKTSPVYHTQGVESMWLLWRNCLWFPFKRTGSATTTTIQVFWCITWKKSLEYRTLENSTLTHRRYRQRRKHSTERSSWHITGVDC